jgi:hypothetical protein
MSRPMDVRYTYEIPNFDQIQAVDQVKTTTVEEFPVAVAAPGAFSNPTNVNRDNEVISDTATGSGSC